MTTTNLEQGGYGTVSPVGLQLGSVEGKQKGSERMSLGTNKLIGAHIAASGQVACASGLTSTTVMLPVVNDAVVTGGSNTVTNYMVLVTATTTAQKAALYVTLVANAIAGTAGSTTGQFDSFTLNHASGSGELVNWVLVHL